MIAKLQYISQGTRGRDHIDTIQRMCISGIDWVQLRLKNMEAAEMSAIAISCREITREHDVKLIINDFVELALECQADGVHLGREDKSRHAARKILGPKIIGATANTIEDIIQISQEGDADYIGLGPLRYTLTKKELSPVLDYEGYIKCLSQVKIKNINIPILAIGGIQFSDIDKLKSYGLYGVAISSSLTNDPNPKAFISETKKILQ